MDLVRKSVAASCKRSETAMKNHKTETKKTLLTAALGAAAACGASAYEVPLTLLSTNAPPIEVHGLASQGYLLSSDYNYLANDTKNGSFQFSEMGLNVSMNPLPHTRIAVQGFDFDVGNVGQYDPFLDYALIEYTVNDELGIRAGRIRRPAGIYNDIQDLDVTRTFVLLPQGIYDARWRDWSAGLDGGELFGEFSLHKLGGISYGAYAGMVNMQENGGVARYGADANGINVDTMDDTPTFGAQVWYNTPISGLRVGANVTYMDDFGFTANSSVLIPVAADVYTPGYVNTHTVGNVLFQQFSIEYLWRNWTFQAEYYTYKLTGWSHIQVNIPAANKTLPQLQTIVDNPDTWYAGVSRRLNKHIELGTYYSMWEDQGLFQNDLALCLRLDIKDWWVFKVEGHYIEGTGLLRDQADNPHLDNNSGWFMLAVKTTFSF